MYLLLKCTCIFLCKNSIITNFIQLIFLQPVDWFSQTKLHYKAPNEGYLCHMQVHLSRNYIHTVVPPPKHISLPSTVATFFTTCLMVVLQPSRYSIFYGRDTPIQLGLPWRSYSCQCLNTETSAWSNRSFTNETTSISYTFRLYIRLVVTL